jgi:serine O-acetyltransferase
MAWLRFGSWLRSHRIRGGPSFVQRRLLRLYGLEIVPGADIGGGCYIAHPSGCTIRATHIGENATIIAAVTVGGAKERDASPVIGDRVLLGAGCRVVGSMTIGDDVKVGANAVVLHDVADGETVVGIPARPVVRAAGAGDGR